MERRCASRTPSGAVSTDAGITSNAAGRLTKPVEKGGKKILIGIDKIRFVMARDDYAYLQTDVDRYFSTVSLAQLEKRLDGHGFFRVHRGYLVNLSMVEEIESVSGGTLLLTLNAVDEKIPVSRRRVSALKKALGL